MAAMIPLKPVAATSGDYYEGYLDFAGKSGVFGWDTNLNNPDEAMEVTVFIDDKQVATITANLFRPDLEGVVGDGHHAFLYQIPAWYFDGMEHSLSVRHEIGGMQLRTDLYGSPRPFRCSLE